MIKKVGFEICLLCCVLIFNCTLTAGQKNSFPAWQEGYLDIHHINTGRGNATFYIIPRRKQVL